MTNLPLKWCRFAGCSNKTRNAGSWCDAHLKNNPSVDSIRQRRQDPTNKLYKRVAWQRMRQLMLASNPMCTRLINGAVCPNPATLVHHLRSPREAPELFTEATNLVCLCASCHPDDAGTPWWKSGEDYIENEFKVMNFFGGGEQ